MGQKGGHAYIWAEVGSRPLMVRDVRHDSALQRAVQFQATFRRETLAPNANNRKVQLAVRASEKMSFQQLMMLACSCRSGLLFLRPVAWNWTALYSQGRGRDEGTCCGSDRIGRSSAARIAQSRSLRWSYLPISTPATPP